jgi:xylulose-5-phosphate/fructose-6-phosphate phosphoketolase
MPGEIIDRPNPQPLASHIPEDVLSLSVKLQKMSITDADLKGLEEFRRASNYIAAGKFSDPLLEGN